jgi:2-polyprenyl-6-methoxyphenol hydroxylase-like FAD-dependent oxidoreductase
VYGDLGWYLPNLLAAADIADDIYYDWLAQIEMPQWHSSRTVLIGDAAYAVSLLAGPRRITRGRRGVSACRSSE